VKNNEFELDSVLVSVRNKQKLPGTISSKRKMRDRQHLFPSTFFKNSRLLVIGLHAFL